MKIEIQGDIPTANSLTDRFGAGQRTKHIDTRYKNESKTETSISRSRVQPRTV